MKDFTVYSKYETFIKQLTSQDDVVIYYNKVTNELMSKFITTFGAEISKHGFTANDVALQFSRRCRLNNETRDVSTTIYVPCVDQYQKQFNVFVINNLRNAKYQSSVIATHCQYKETSNPLCINNANIKDILSEQDSLTMQDVFNAKV